MAAVVVFLILYVFAWSAAIANGNWWLVAIGTGIIALAILMAWGQPSKDAEKAPEELARRLSGYQWAKVKEQVMLRDGMVCRTCGMRVELTLTPRPSRAHVDHIIPLSRGGTNAMANLQVLCQTCNLRKGAR
ncbi:HNH endonuclease [Agromyces sp. ZXT2-6]|uniref:HNH endonuclease n=1 Tax=Agromyces sp. ZXT2-6 TaxID=3461153 RepID=UPI0040550E25